MKTKIISKTDRETKFKIDDREFTMKIEKDNFGPCAVIYDEFGKFVNKKWIDISKVDKEIKSFIKYMEWKIEKEKNVE